MLVTCDEHSPSSLVSANKSVMAPSTALKAEGAAALAAAAVVSATLKREKLSWGHTTTENPLKRYFNVAYFLGALRLSVVRIRV